MRSLKVTELRNCSDLKEVSIFRPGNKYLSDYLTIHYKEVAKCLECPVIRTERINVPHFLPVIHQNHHYSPLVLPYPPIKCRGLPFWLESEIRCLENISTKEA